MPERNAMEPDTAIITSAVAIIENSTLPEPKNTGAMGTIEPIKYHPPTMMGAPA